MSAETPEMQPEKVFFEVAYSSLPDGYPESPTPDQAALMYVATRVIGFDQAGQYFDDFADSDLGYTFRSFNLEPPKEAKRFSDDQLVILIDEMELLDPEIKLALIPLVRRVTTRTRLFVDSFIKEGDPEIKQKAYGLLLESVTDIVDGVLPSFERSNQKRFVSNLLRATRYIKKSVGEPGIQSELVNPLIRQVGRIESIFPGITADAARDLESGSYRGDNMTPTGRPSKVHLEIIETVALGPNGKELLKGD